MKLETAREERGKELLAKEARRFLALILNLGRIALGLLLLVLAERVAFGGLSTETAIAVAGLAAAALLVLAVTPELMKLLSRRVSKIAIGPFAMEVFEEAERVAPSGATEDPETGDRSVTSVLALRLKIERKLTYVAKHVLDDSDEHPTFLTVGSLKYDKLLPAEEADVVNRLMTLRDADLQGLPAEERDRLLGPADALARNIRASILHCLVWKILKEMREEDEEWSLKKIRRGENRRKDLLAEKGEHRFRIATVFATDLESRVLQRAEDRLRPKEGKQDGYARRAIVLPHRTASELDPAGNPAIVTTDELPGWLSRCFAQATETEAARG